MKLENKRKKKRKLGKTYGLKRDAVPKTARNDEYGKIKKQMHFGKVVRMMNYSCMARAIGSVIITIQLTHSVRDENCDNDR